MKKKDAIAKLNRQIDEIKKVKATAQFGATFTKWQRDTRVALLNRGQEEGSALDTGQIFR